MTVSANLSNTKLFEPITVGRVELKNRLVYAPCTRIRAIPGTCIPTDSMLEYYRRRAVNNGGLLIFEATLPKKSMGGFAPSAPNIETKEQVQAFKQIVDAVHKEGTFASLQLWHPGRTASMDACKAPSKVYLDDAHEEKLKSLGLELEVLTIEEIKQIPKDFADAAKRSCDEAGFDMIEIHGAHGFLFDQFLQDAINKRTDEYGGSIENKARLLLETIDACIEAVGAERVSVRLSPYGNFQGAGDNVVSPIVNYGYILSQLETRAKEGKRLAYVSVVEPRTFANEDANLEWVPALWRGITIYAGNYLDESNIEKLGDYINNSENVLVAVGRQYTSNPDLANRLRNGYPLTPYDRDTFYSGPTNNGYLTFTNYGEKPDYSKDDVELKPLA